MNPKKGEILLTTGLFDPVMSGKPVEFIKTVKERGLPLKWEVKLLQPIYDIETMQQTPIHFFWLGEKDVPVWVREKLEGLNTTYLAETETCCDKYNTPFCPECGTKL